MQIRKSLWGPAIVFTGCCFLAAPAWSQADKPSDRVQEGAKPGTSNKPGTPDADQTRKVQQALKDKGFYSGPVDGVMSKTTQDAIRTLQKSKNLNVTGNLDDNTARELGLEK